MTKLSETNRSTISTKAADRLKKSKKLGNDPAYKDMKKGRVVEYHKGVHDDIIQTKNKN